MQYINIGFNMVNNFQYQRFEKVSFYTYYYILILWLKNEQLEKLPSKNTSLILRNSTFEDAVGVQ